MGSFEDEVLRERGYYEVKEAKQAKVTWLQTMLDKGFFLPRSVDTLVDPLHVSQLHAFTRQSHVVTRSHT